MAAGAGRRRRDGLGRAAGSERFGRPSAVRGTTQGGACPCREARRQTSCGVARAELSTSTRRGRHARSGSREVSMSRSSTPDCCAARPSAMSGCESSSEVKGRCSTSLTTHRPTKSTICSRQPPTLVPSVGGGSVGMRKMARIGCLHGWRTGGGTVVFEWRLGEAPGALCGARAAAALHRSPEGCRAQVGGRVAPWVRAALPLPGRRV